MDRRMKRLLTVVGIAACTAWVAVCVLALASPFVRAG